MAGMSSFEATRQIRKERPETRVVFLSMYDDEDYLAECVEIGANGYILKESPAEQLVMAIREVHRGGSYLSPRLLTKLVDGFRSGPGRGGAATAFRHVDQARARDFEAAGRGQVG